MKKIFYLCIILTTIILTSIGIILWRYQQPEENLSNIWKTTRILPDNLALNAYLAGNIARKKHDISKALDAYQKVLEKDPNNTGLLKDFYVLSLFLGTPQKTLPYLDKIPVSLRKILFSDYLKATQIFLEDPDQLLAFLKQKEYQKADIVLIPLMRSWYSAKINDKKAALESLNSLKDEKFAFLLGYQKFLLGIYFNDEELQDAGIQEIQGKKLPAIGFFPLLKKQALKKESWEKTDLYQQFQKMEKLYPATAELIITLGQQKLDCEKGLSEAFYFLSTEGTSGLFTKEEAVFLNSIALYLQPDKKLSLVWGAELTQAFDFPYMSVYYYQQIPTKSATLLFKHATALLLDNQTEEAEKIMDELEKTNTTHVPLLTLMGQNYVTLKKYQKALDIYNRLIPLLEKNPQNKPLAEAYVARANLYQLQHQEDKMIDDLQKAQILMPDDAMLQNDIGYHYLEIGKVEEGFDLIQSAYQKKPQDPYILDSLAYAYYQKKQPLLALTFAEKALNLLPQSALINMHLGDIYKDIGRIREAGFQYKKALDLKDNLTPEMKTKIQEKIDNLTSKSQEI